jgi:hypothetical protein
MSHHYGPELPPLDPSMFSQKDLGLGATGRFPEGKLTKDDQGEIKIGITVKDDKIVIAFGKPVEWIGFTREQAIQIGETLINRARQTEQL